jgi:hypothetical protein
MRVDWIFNFDVHVACIHEYNEYFQVFVPGARTGDHPTSGYDPYVHQ